MKRLVLTLTVTAMLGASSVAMAHSPRWTHAGRHGGSRIYYAPVTSVRPLYRNVYVPERTCRREPVVVERRGGNNTAGTLLGAVIGGVLGHTIGKGDGRQAATVAGAVIGGAVGHRGARGGDDRETRYVQRCDRRSVRAGRRVVAYQVTYRYRGRAMQTRLNHDPGRRLRLRVADRVRVAE